MMGERIVLDWAVSQPNWLLENVNEMAKRVVDVVGGIGAQVGPFFSPSFGIGCCEGFESFQTCWCFARSASKYFQRTAYTSLLKL